MTETNVNKEVTTNPGVTVKMSKLVEGIGTVFIGVLTMLEALDASTAKTFVSGFVGGTSVVEGFEAAAGGTTETTTKEAPVMEKPTAEVKVAETAEPEATEAATESVAEVDTSQDDTSHDDTPAVSITVDDITRVIVGKIKQKRSNSDKIGSLLKTYGAARVSELPPSKYEAFLTDISQL